MTSESDGLAVCPEWYNYTGMVQLENSLQAK